MINILIDFRLGPALNPQNSVCCAQSLNQKSAYDCCYFFECQGRVELGARRRQRVFSQEVSYVVEVKCLNVGVANF